MATLPPWLTNLEPIADALYKAKRSAGTDFQSVLARMNLAQQAAAQRDTVALNRQRMAQQAAQDAAQLEMSAQQAAAQGARADRQLNMTEAQLDRSVQQDRDKALMANRQFQAVTGYQSCVQGGGDPRTCALKHLPEIVLSSPSSFVSLLPEPTDPHLGQVLDVDGVKMAGVGGNRLQVVQPKTAPVPSSIQTVDEIMKNDQQMNAALQAGDTATADLLKQRGDLLKSQMRGFEATMGQDSDGKPVFSFGSKGIGRAGDPSKPTVSTATDAQRTLSEVKTSLGMVDNLIASLQEEDLGVRGVWGSIRDTVGGQFNPDLVDKESVRNRSNLVKTREALLKAMKAAGPMTDKDAERMLPAFPSSGPLENYTHAISQLESARKWLEQRGSTAAKQIGVRPPHIPQEAWDILQRRKRNEISPEEALNLLRQIPGIK